VVSPANLWQPRHVEVHLPRGQAPETFGVTGHAGFLAAQNYEDHKTANIMSFPPPHVQQASGTVYAVCR